MSWSLLLQAVASLAAVLALVVLAGRAARMRAVPGADPHALRLAATLALDARRRLHLVNVAGGAVLVLTGGANDTILAWPAPPSPGHPAAPVP